MMLKLLLGSVCMLLVFQHGAAIHNPCDIDTPSDKVDFPKFPLKYGDLLGKVIPDMQHSRPYYEIYSFDFKIPDLQLPLPILRKVAIRWNLINSTGMPQFTNDYAGWAPYMSDCEHGQIDLTHKMISPRDTLLFEFDVVYPTQERFVGTSFSKCPERYLINWYCPKGHFVEARNKRKFCRYGVRMSIYSATGANDVPWHLVAQDICSNGTPKMDDYRWTMTHDAPEQCDVMQPPLRKKRSTDGYSRHYL